MALRPAAKQSLKEGFLILLLLFFFVIPPLIFMPGNLKGHLIFTEYREIKLAATMILFWAFAFYYALFYAEKHKKSILAVVKEPTFWLLGFIALFSILSAFWSLVPEAALYEGIQWITLTIMYLVLTSLFIQDKKYKKLALGSLLGTFILVTAIGLIQTQTAIPLLMPIPGTKFGSTFGAKNTCFLSLASQFFLLCFACWMALKNKRIISGLFLGLCITAEFIYMAVSLSRTTYAAIAAGTIMLVIFFAYSAKKKVMFFTGVALFLLVIGIALAAIRIWNPGQWRYVEDRVSKRIIPLLTNPALFFKTARGQVILDTLDMVRDHPLGVGAGNWLFNYPLYHKRLTARAYNKKIQIRKVHNDYVQNLAELGIPGFVAMIGLIGLQFWKLGCIIRHREAAAERMWALFLFSQFLAACVMMFFSFYLEFPYRKFLFVFLLVLNYSSFFVDKSDPIKVGTYLE